MRWGFAHHWYRDGGGGGDSARLECEEGGRELGAGPSSSAGDGGGGPGASPPFLSIQVPPSASPWVQVPDSPSLSVQVLPWEELCSDGTRCDYDNLTYDDLHLPCRKRGPACEDSEAALKARLSTVDAEARRRARDAEDAVDASDESPEVRRWRSCLGNLPQDFVSDKDVVRGRA